MTTPSHEVKEQRAREEGYLAGRLEVKAVVAGLESQIAEQQRLVIDAMAALMKEREVNLRVEHLVGYSEIADKLGVSLSTAQRWAERRDTTQFPRPIKIMTQCHIYDIRSVNIWFANWCSTRRQSQSDNYKPESISTFHNWPDSDVHMLGPWQAKTGLPKPTQYRTCIHPRCHEMQTRDAPMG